MGADTGRTVSETAARPAIHGARGHSSVRLALLSGFELTSAGEPLSLPMSAQRVLAFLALQIRPVHRSSVAGQLWVDVAEERACASLRSTLWRLRQSGSRFVHSSPTHLALSPEVSVDLHEAVALARQVLEGSTSLDALAWPVGYLSGDLLPDWYDDWVLIEQERFRQLRLHALETLCDRLRETRRFAEAIEAGLSAVLGEPLRESAHRSLIRAYLAEGNSGEAIRQLQLCRRLLADELGIEPSSETRALVQNL